MGVPALNGTRSPKGWSQKRVDGYKEDGQEKKKHGGKEEKNRAPFRLK